MIAVEVDSLTPSLSGIRLGMVVRYGEGGPVRFVEGLLPWSLLSRDVHVAMGKHFDSLLDVEPQDDPLF
jgi:hypothetical protein